MVATAWLTVLDNHLEGLFINLGYVKTAALNGFVCGIGVDVAFSFLLIYYWDMRMRGCALVQLTVRLVRVLFWLAQMAVSGLTRQMLVPPRGSGATDPLLTRRELGLFLGQGMPQYGAMLAGWLIFELQLVLLTNIDGVTHAARAAGADWINVEGTIAAVQVGWIQVAKMRCLKLLGSADPGAPKAFALLLTLAFLLVALLNIPLLLPSSVDGLANLMSNDDGVYAVFRRLVWVLVVHAQTRIVDLTCGSVLVPMGYPRMRVAIAFVSFWCVAAPVAVVGTMTSTFSLTTLVKVQLCMACTSIGQMLNALCYGAFLLRLDWAAAARLIGARANTDRRAAADEAEADNDAPARISSVVPIVLAEDAPHHLPVGVAAPGCCVRAASSTIQ